MLKEFDLQSVSTLRASSEVQSTLTLEQRNFALKVFSKLIEEYSTQIILASKADQEREIDLSLALKSRLVLDEKKLSNIVTGIKEIERMPDPLGIKDTAKEIAPHLSLSKKMIPLGIIAIVFESRPDVIPQIASLFLKTGNIAILKPGKELKETLNVFKHLFRELFEKVTFLDQNWINFVESRNEFWGILDFNGAIDLVIPRGSNELVQSIMQNTKIPVLGHADGVCHIYIDDEADTQMALNVVINAKTNYPSACNAVETVLVNYKIAKDFLVNFKIAAELNNIVINGCSKSVELISCNLNQNDWHHEYSSLEISIKIVDDLESAISHINQHGSHHTDVIISSNKNHVELFINKVDSACVFANASSRWCDGFRFGFGAEIGIGTGRLHARGPVGVDGLLTYKYVLCGQGNIV